MYDYHVILDLEMNPISKDFKEASKDLRKETIEIGAVKLDSKFNIIDRFKVFIKPQYNHQVTPYITRLTGIVSTDTMKAPFFEEAFSSFVSWIGEEGLIRVYSWSSNDLAQFKRECTFKNIEFPKNMKRWMDVQRVFPRMMGLSNKRRHIALKEAVQYFNISLDTKKVHDALYDSELTTELLIPLLNGDYKKQVECMNSFTKSVPGNTIGDLFGNELAELLKQLSDEDAEE